MFSTPRVTARGVFVVNPFLFSPPLHNLVLLMPRALMDKREDEKDVEKMV
jgi:hypothetical protein